MLSEEHKEQKKNQLLDKCFELFVKQGLENTSINELANYCKTYKSALYIYFDSKDEIVVECAVRYMNTLDKKIAALSFDETPNLKTLFVKAFEMLSNEKSMMRYIYQVISSPKYGEKCRDKLLPIYGKYMNYSRELSDIYHVPHDMLRPYYLLFVATIHDFCLWENSELVSEKLNYIYQKIEGISC